MRVVATSLLPLGKLLCGLLYGMVCVLLLPSYLRADFIEPLQVSLEEGNSQPDIVRDFTDHISIVFERDGDIFLTSSLIDLGEEEVTISDVEEESTGPRIASGASGRLHIIYSEETGAENGADVVLASNNGGSFTVEVVAESDEDESQPDIVFGPGAVIDVVWTQVPTAGDPEIRYLRHGDGNDSIRVSSGKTARIVMTSEGDSHVFYQKGGHTFHRALPADDDEFGDEEQLTDLEGTVKSIQVSIDELDAIHVIFTSDDAVYYMNNSDGDFSEPDQLIAGPVDGSIGVAATDLGDVAVAYVEDGIVMILRTLEGAFSEQEPEEVTPDSAEASKPAIAVDSLGYVHVAYLEDEHVYYTTDTPTPTADFSVDASGSILPVTAVFDNASEGVIHDYLWDFGDGSVSRRKAPTHVYRDEGTFTVSLTVSGPGGTSTHEVEDLITTEGSLNVMWIPTISIFSGMEVSHPVYVNTETPLQGFLISVGYDDELTPIDEVSLIGTVSKTLQPEFLHVDIDADGEDSTVLFSCIFDFSAPFNGRNIKKGTGHLIATLNYVVPDGLFIGTNARLDFVEIDGLSSHFSALDGTRAISIIPFLVGGVASVDTLSGPTFLRGDANADGILHLADPIMMLRYLFADGDDPVCFDAADQDDDGDVTLLDAVAILSHLFRDGKAPRYPYPSAGFDPTDDDLEDCE